MDPLMQWGYRKVTRFEVFFSVGYAADTLKTYLNLFNLSEPGKVGNLSAMERVANVIAFDRDDWLLPTYGELSEMMQLAAQDNSKLRLSVSTSGVRYWSSSLLDYPLSAIAAFVNLSAKASESENADQMVQFSVRPIRYFG